MSEVRITKVKYIIQYYLKDLGRWSDSDWNNGIKFKSDLTNMLQLLKRARDNSAKAEEITGIEHKPYRLVKQTHSITTEVVDE